MDHKRRGRTVPALLAGCLISSLTTYAALPSAARAGEAKGDLFVQRQMAHGQRTGWTSVILKLDGSLTPAQDNALRSLGADIYRRLPIVSSVALRVPNRNLQKLASLPFVQRLSADVQVVKTDEFTVKSSGADVAYSQYGLTGSGIGVAIVDSGIRPHMDLTKPGLLGTVLLSSNRIVKNVNFVAGETTTNDLCGHGTHVAGIVGGNGESSDGLLAYRTFYGIARKVNLVNVRVLDRVGQGNVSTVIAGIQWVMSNKSNYNIRVLNLSLGHPVGESYTTDPLCQAVEAAWKKGIVVVCAAGNEGRMNMTPGSGTDNEGWGTAYGSINSPANSPYVITVGATKSMDGKRVNDRIATYSGRGPSRLDYVLKPDIIAPGNQIISTLADDSYLDTEHSDTNLISAVTYLLSPLTGDASKYFRLSGTSMAAPVVSGAAAMMLQKYPGLTPDTVKARLMMSADKWTDAAGNSDPCTYGAGYLNIPAALRSTVTATQYAMSPFLTEDENGNVFIDMTRAIWGSKAIWGTGVSDLRAVWGTKAIWGSSLNVLDASKAIWGSTVWGDRAVWGTTTGAVDLTSKAINGE
jgi:serine protease AprX